MRVLSGATSVLPKPESISLETASLTKFVLWQLNREYFDADQLKAGAVQDRLSGMAAPLTSGISGNVSKS
jgi:hypothetical protein